jgi:predicted kinase
MANVFIACGYVASGKSTMADALAKTAGLTVIRTDDVRKRLFPKEFDFGSVDLNDSESVQKIESWIMNNPEADLQQILNPLSCLGSAYAGIVSKHSSKIKEQKNWVYDQAFAELGRLLNAGVDVLFDATFSSAEMRQRVYRVAVENGAKNVYIIQVVCDQNIVEARLARRVSGKQKTTSNAKELAVFQAVKKEFDESRIQDDVPGINFARIAYDTGKQTIKFFGKEDEATKTIKSVLSILSQMYGGN